jgi:hypothetical protein
LKAANANQHNIQYYQQWLSRAGQLACFRLQQVLASRVLSWSSHKLMRPDVITASPMLSPGMMAAKGAARGGTTTRGAGRLRLQEEAQGLYVYARR